MIDLIRIYLTATGSCTVIFALTAIAAARIRKSNLNFENTLARRYISILNHALLGNDGQCLFPLIKRRRARLLLAVIVLMILIIRSLRRSIRDERPLGRRNVWYLRSIGVLTILAELLNGLLGRAMNLRAAELLAGSGLTVDTSLHISYSMIIMGLLILFSAEVFAIGQNLSEEQKLTI